MMKKTLRMVLLMMVASLIVACGTSATPVFEAPDEEEVIDAQTTDEEVEVAVAASETPIPPTATPTEEPTEVPTEIPTEVPTEEPTAAPVDPIARLIASRDPADGEALYNQMFAETGFACATCHHVDVPDTLIGPSMLNIKDVAGDRVEGQGVERYLYNSIINPNDYIVEGFVEGVMPATWGDVLSDTEVYDIIAYMLTLEG